MVEPSTLIPNLIEIMDEHAQPEGEVHLEPTEEVHLETTEENRPSEQPEVQPVVRQQKRKEKERRLEREIWVAEGSCILIFFSFVLFLF